MNAAAYPVRLEARLDDGLSRWLWLVKWVLVVPHAIVLAVLWVGFVLATFGAWLAVLVTGRYPRSLFAYDLGVLRWTWRVHYYAYGRLATDRYPPFTLADVEDYPARLDLVRPERVSRPLARSGADGGSGTSAVPSASWPWSPQWCWPRPAATRGRCTTSSSG
jgi:hypothetical protein